MTMPSLHLGNPWYYAAWQGGFFIIAFLLNSFVEWTVHKFLMHSRKIIKFGYDLHAAQHHVLFDGGDAYHAVNEDVKQHVRFVPRDYLLLLAFTTPIWLCVELAAGRPFLFGGMAATLAGLQLFNSLHWRYHVPSDTWFQRTRFFRYLKENHRLHHGDMTKNFNVNFFPIADFLLGTLKK